MNCLIIAGGAFTPSPAMEKLIGQVDLIVAADRGADHLKQMGLLPHFIIGDLDSISPETITWFKKKQVPFITYPTGKDNTDTDLCVSFALEKGARSIILAGTTGHRLDHTLANILLLEKLTSLKIPARIVDHNNEIYLVSGTGINRIDLDGTSGDLLSIVPISKTVEGVCLEGLEYPLKKATMSRGSTLGISNCFKNGHAKISVERGTLLVSKSWD